MREGFERVEKDGRVVKGRIKGAKIDVARVELWNFDILKNFVFVY